MQLQRDVQENKTCEDCGHTGRKYRVVEKKSGKEHRGWRCLGKYCLNEKGN